MILLHPEQPTIFFILLLVGAIACATLISVADFRRRIIPDAYLFPLMLIGLILITFFGFPISMRDAVIGATFGYAVSAIIGFAFDYFIRHRSPDATPPIGMGDIKLIGVGGLRERRAEGREAHPRSHRPCPRRNGGDRPARHRPAYAPVGQHPHRERARCQCHPRRVARRGACRSSRSLLSASTSTTSEPSSTSSRRHAESAATSLA